MLSLKKHSATVTKIGQLGTRHLWQKSKPKSGYRDLYRECCTDRLSRPVSPKVWRYVDVADYGSR